MKISRTLQKFIEDNIELIDNNKFDDLYSIHIADWSDIPVHEVTDLLHEAGIDPLQYLSVVPVRYLDSSVRSHRNIVIPSTVTKIGGGAFKYLDVQSVTIEEGCTEICRSAFADNPFLTVIHLPHSLTKVRSRAFTRSPVEKLYYNGTLEEFQTISKGSYFWFDFDNLDACARCTLICNDRSISMVEYVEV